MRKRVVIYRVNAINARRFVAVLAASLFTDLSPVIFVAAAALCGIVIQHLIRREK